jgi:2-polyprenyl-3-methyl-5-hydroxy-6-metoxy-1,4-benzoquinol methylase
MATRIEVMLERVPRNATIVEIGPLANPIAPRRQGWNTKTIDVAPKAELMELYSNLPGVDAIEEVDFIWRDGPLIEAVPPEYYGTFDIFIASHVIEHQPDLLAFLQCAETLLKPTGLVILAIPDKRFCFDYFQPITLTGDVLSRRNSGRAHGGRETFNNYAYSLLANHAFAWGQEPVDVNSLALVHPLEHAYTMFEKAQEYQSASTDENIHAWRFTPASFELLLLELARLGLTDWHADRISPPAACEFFAWLTRGGREIAAALDQWDLRSRRLALLKRTLWETKEQIDFLTADRGSAPAASSVEPEETGSEENRILRAELSSLASQLAEQIAARSELADHYCKAMSNVHPSDPQIWTMCGDALKAAGKYLDAELAYRRSREAGETNTDLDRTAAIDNGPINPPRLEANSSTSFRSEQNPEKLFLSLVAQEQPKPVLEFGCLQFIPGIPTHHQHWFPYISREDFVKSDLFAGVDVDEVADLHALPAAWHGRFAACFSLAVLEHVARPWIAAREMFRVLRPGGLCYVSTVQTFPLHDFPGDYFRFSGEALSVLFTDAGFEVLSVGYDHRTKIVVSETFMPSGLLDIWNEAHPSYGQVHLVARRPAVSARNPDPTEAP